MKSNKKTKSYGKITLRLGLSLAMACTLAACSQPNSWSKPGMNEVHFDGDLAQCRRQAAGTTQSIQQSENNGLERSDRQDRLVKRCMEGKGYTLSGQ